MGRKTTLIVKNVIAWLVTAIMLAPLLLVLVTAFKSNSESAAITLTLPKEWVFNNFAIVIEKGKLVAGFFNSMLYSCGATLLTATLAAMAAYVFSRQQSKGFKALYFYMVLGIVIPINFVALMKVMQILQLNNYAPRHKQPHKSQQRRLCVHRVPTVQPDRGLTVRSLSVLPRSS